MLARMRDSGRLEELRDHLGNLRSEHRRYGIPYLMELLGPISLKEIVVRKRLQSRGLSYSQASTL